LLYALESIADEGDLLFWRGGLLSFHDNHAKGSGQKEVATTFSHQYNIPCSHVLCRQGRRREQLARKVGA
jgi:hypothetical protein